MAAIPTILRGDDTGAIAIRLDDEHDYTGATLAFAYQGVTRTFAGLVAGGSVTVHFTRDETARMRLGAYSVLMELIGPTGGRETVANAEMKIKVTDCLAEVNCGSSFVIRPGTTGGVPVTDVGDMSDQYTLAELKDKVNQIVRVLAQRSILGAAIALLCAADAFAEVQTARLDELPNDALVVTNVTESAGGEYLPLSGGTLTGDLNLQNDEPGRSTPKITVGSEAHQGMTTVDETGIGQSCARGPGVDRGFRIENDEGTVKIKKIGWTSDGNVEFTLPDVGGCLVTDAQTEPIRQAANDASAWSVSTYNFMTGGRTNCWFSGTNYVFGAEAAARTRFAWEDGMDAATVPCSMALWEIRDGERQVVWDQRDWTAWYWTFKARQMQAEVDEKIAALGNAVTNDANYAWAKRYASDGTPNPDASTTFIDTPSVTLSPGMKWETVATVSGAAYWTIVGNGAVIGGSGTNATLIIRDFEGNDIMTVTKGEHRLAFVEHGEFTGQSFDENGFVCFDMLADAEPVGYFSVTIDASDFIEQTDPDCPAQCSWEDLHNGKYRVHFLLKPGIQARCCFAKFKVAVEEKTVIRYNAAHEISGGLRYNGVKIAPDISGNPAVGTVIQWKVVH